MSELAARALESLGGEKPASKQDSLKDLADKALKKADKKGNSKSSSSSGDSIPDLARRALNNLNLPQASVSTSSEAKDDDEVRSLARDALRKIYKDEVKHNDKNQKGCDKTNKADIKNAI